MKKILLAALTLSATLGIAAAELPEGKILFESFEGWDGTQFWVPDGWSVEMKGENADNTKTWTPERNPYLPAAADGLYYYAVSPSKTPQDEWLISPEVQLTNGMVATFSIYAQIPFLYVVEPGVTYDAEKMEFIGEKKVAATLQLLVQPEGGEWETVFDLAEKNMNRTYMDMVLTRSENLEPYEVALDDYDGKKVRIAFRYVGVDGDLMLLDAIGVGYPVLDGVSFTEPWSILYWGPDRSADMAQVMAPIAQVPVFEPLTWQNYSDNGDTFTWTYINPENKAETLTEDGEFLTVTFYPDYSNDTTKVNNFYYPHTLKASADGYTPGTYTAPYLCLQAGGKPEMTFTDGSTYEGCLLPFSTINRGIGSIYCEDTVEGLLGIPIFGHDSLGTVDEYWLKYSLNGTPKAETDYNHHVGFGNLFMPSEAPLVVHGVTLFAYGELLPDAEIIANIYALNAAMSSEYSTLEKIATASCKGTDVITYFPDQRGDLVLPFDFEEPVILKATAEHPAYMIMIENFRNNKVPYLAPRQSIKPDPLLNWAYMMHDVNLEAHVADRPAGISITPVVHKEDINSEKLGEYLYAAFAIGLNAEYPWLTCDATTVEFAGETEVALGSYYDGSMLTVEAPEGIAAEVTGRYDQCKVTLTNTTTKTIEGTVKVSGPGVEVEFNINGAQASIAEINSAADARTEIYDLQGRKIANPRSGLYIINGQKVVK